MSITDAELNPLDTEVGAVVEALALCLCAQILADGIQPVCFCGIIPGDSLPMDLVQGSCRGKNGAAYVRLVNTYPSAQVGVADITPRNCQVLQGFDLEVGIFRNVTLPKDGRSKAEPLLAAHRLQLADERAMRRAISCCEWLDAEDFVTGLYTPTGPEGGVLGGTIPISCQIP